MFFEKSSKHENVPPTKYALHLHVIKDFLLVRQKQDKANVKTILLMICMRYL